MTSRRSRAHAATRLLAMLALVPLPGIGLADRAAAAAEKTSPGVWKNVSRVVAVGDVHGNHDKLVGLLGTAELIDDELRWVGGEQHLVVAGDFLDRGLDDRPLMDLLRRLERESIAAGGRVHVLLGNHEVMNLLRDLRYVSPASYSHFAPEERKADRKAAARQFTERLGLEWNAYTYRRFEERFPKGYFARLRALDADGEYGGWLMRLPTIVKINGVAYVHGGLNEEFAPLGVEGINRRVTDLLAQALKARAALERENMVSPEMSTLEVLEAARTAAEKGRTARTARRREKAEAYVEAATDPILRIEGPLWYRGNALRDERLERDIVDRVLEALDAEALVVSHSPTSMNRITSRFHGRLFRIDHGIDGSDAALALVAELGEIMVLNGSTRETSTPVREFPLGQLGAAGVNEMSDAEIVELLSRSRVVDVRPLGKGSTRPQLMMLERRGEVRRAIFKNVEDRARNDRYQHEVAAYRLDRILGLGMVPVTVLRTLKGKTGSLQVWVDAALDLEAAEGYNISFFETDGKVSQLALGRVFDALIGNDGRKPADILGLTNAEKVLLIDHSKAFSTSPELPASVAGELTVPERLVTALEGLDRAILDAELGKLISARQIEALLARRDAILASLAPAPTESP